MSRSALRLAVVVLVLSAASLAVGTGASVLSGPTDPVSEEVTLSPAPGANGDYAYLADGELVVDLTPANPNVDGDGLSAGGVTTLDDVFVIHYGGDRFARVWLTHDSDAVTLRARGRPIQSESNAVVLDANRSTAVGLRVDTTGSTDGLLEDVTVHGRLADPEDVAAPSVAGTATRDDERSIRSFAPDDSTRTFTVTNAPAGTPVTLDTDRLVVDDVEAGTLTLDELAVTSDTGSMSVDVRVVDDAERMDTGPGVAPLGALDVEDGGTVTAATFRFSAAPAYLDERETTLDRLVVRRNDGTGWRSLDPDPVGMRNGRAVFEADSPGFSTFVVGVRTPAIRVTGAGLDRTTATPGESVSASASVTNDGLAAGERTVSLTVDGDPVATRTLSLDPGESRTVRFDVAADSPGEYAVAADGVEAGTLVVEDAPQATDAGADTDTSTPRAVEADAADGDRTPESTAPAPTASPPARPVAEPGALGLSSPSAGLIGVLFTLFVALLAVRRLGREDGDGDA
jgi:hypothetical protein